MKCITKLRQARRLSSERKHSSAPDKEQEFCSTLDDNSEKRSVIRLMLRKRNKSYYCRSVMMSYLARSKDLKSAVQTDNFF